MLPDSTVPTTFYLKSTFFYFKYLGTYQFLFQHFWGVSLLSLIWSHTTFILNFISMLLRCLDYEFDLCVPSTYHLGGVSINEWFKLLETVILMWLKVIFFYWNHISITYLNWSLIIIKVPFFIFSPKDGFSFFPPPGSNDGSNFNFDCRNVFLGVDYIGLDTSQSKIDGFCQGGGGEIGIGKIITK